jgi:hypothetical protein
MVVKKAQSTPVEMSRWVSEYVSESTGGECASVQL